MRYLLILVFFSTLTAKAQLTFNQAQDSLQKFHLGSTTDFNDFLNHPGYGAGVILTRDGGAAGFGDGDNGLELIKLDKKGNVQWRKSIKKPFETIEPQCVAQDSLGKLYVIMLTYNPAGYRGGSERVVCFSKAGAQLWDKMLGPYTLLNNPTVSYVRTIKDGRIEMRGHVVREKPVGDKDPTYRYWQGWYDSKGVLSVKTGEVIDWKNPEWMKKFKPE